MTKTFADDRELEQKCYGCPGLAFNEETGVFECDGECNEKGGSNE